MRSLCLTQAVVDEVQKAIGEAREASKVRVRARGGARLAHGVRREVRDERERERLAETKPRKARAMPNARDGTVEHAALHVVAL